MFVSGEGEAGSRQKEEMGFHHGFLSVVRLSVKPFSAPGIQLWGRGGKTHHSFLSMVRLSVKPFSAPGIQPWGSGGKT